MADTLTACQDAWEAVLTYVVYRVPQDFSLVARLLCCSSSMTSLIHRVCAGLVDVVLVSKQQYHPGKYDIYYSEWLLEAQQAAKVWQQWLAKHGRLLDTMFIDIWPEQEPYVAAGLIAAAGVAASRPMFSLQPSTQHQADAAAGGGVPWLQLRCVKFPAPPSPELLLSISCDTLEVLTVYCPQDTVPEQQQAAALAQLKSLKELTFAMPLLRNYKAQDYSASFAAFGKLTALTKLDFAGVDWLDEFNQPWLDLLPASLKQLCAVIGFGKQPPLNYSHLTALERLSLDHAQPGLILPPSTTHLELKICDDAAPVLALQQLKSLCIWRWALKPMGPLDAAAFQQVAAMPNLEHISLGMEQEVGGWGGNNVDQLSDYFTPKLRSLALIEGGLGKRGLEDLGKFTQLSSLLVSAWEFVGEPRDLCNGLSKLTNLEYLNLWVPEFRVLTEGRFAGRSEHHICSMEKEEAIAELLPELLSLRAKLPRLRDDVHNVTADREAPVRSYVMGTPVWSMMGHVTVDTFDQKVVYHAGTGGAWQTNFALNGPNYPAAVQRYLHTQAEFAIDRYIDWGSHPTG